MKKISISVTEDDVSNGTVDVDISDILNDIAPLECVKYHGEEDLLKEIDISSAVKFYGVSPILDDIGLTEIVSQCGSTLLDEFSVEDAYDYFGEELLGKFTVQELSEYIKEELGIDYFVLTQLTGVVNCLSKNIYNIKQKKDIIIPLMQLLVECLKK